MVRVGQFVVLTILLFSISAFAQTSAPSVPSAPAARSQTGPAFDVNAAVETYLAKIPSAQRARSNAYFEGGYWLLLWDFLTTVFVMWLLLALPPVGAHARPGRTYYPVPSAANGDLLGSVHRRSVGAHVPDEPV